METRTREGFVILSGIVTHCSPGCSPGQAQLPPSSAAPTRSEQRYTQGKAMPALSLLGSWGLPCHNYTPVP